MSACYRNRLPDVQIGAMTAARLEAYLQLAGCKMSLLLPPSGYELVWAVITPSSSHRSTSLLHMVLRYNPPPDPFQGAPSAGHCRCRAAARRFSHSAPSSECQAPSLPAGRPAGACMLLIVHYC